MSLYSRLVDKCIQCGGINLGEWLLNFRVGYVLTKELVQIPTT